MQVNLQAPDEFLSRTTFDKFHLSASSMLSPSFPNYLTTVEPHLCLLWQFLAMATGDKIFPIKDPGMCNIERPEAVVKGYNRQIYALVQC